jgi:hypothetical protein
MSARPGAAQAARRCQPRPAAVHRHRPAAAGHRVPRMDRLKTAAGATLQGVLHPAALAAGRALGTARRQLRRGFSAHASAVELCLFDADGRHRDCAACRCPRAAAMSGMATCRGAGPGLVYGLRAHGPWRPDRGHRFNPHKLLLDPWAREIVGRLRLARPQHFGADARTPAAHGRARQRRQRAEGRVVTTASTGAPTARCARRWTDSVLYELHVRASAAAAGGVPEACAAPYAGLARRRHRPPASAWASPPSACCRCSSTWTNAPGGTGPGQLLGLQHAGLLLPRPALCHAAAGRARATSSAPWCGGCMRPASRCCWTWSTTTPPRATNTAPRSAGAAWTTPAGTACPPDHRKGYENHSGCGNTLDVHHPRGAADGDGQPALLGAGDARGRLPLRPGAGAGPRRPRLRTPGRLLQGRAQDPVLPASS